MKKKNIISLSVALSFLTLSVTGLLLYLVRHNGTTTVIHVVFGLLFVAFAIFHIINNWSSLVGYTAGGGSKLKKEFLWSFAFVGAFLVGSFFHLPPFQQIEEFGSMMRRLGGNGRAPRVMFEEIETNKETTGTAVRFILQKGKEAKQPALAIWVEDSTHAFVENLFIPSKIAAVAKGGDDDKKGKPELKDFAPESFPQWKAKATIQNPNYQKETPGENFFLNTKTKGVGTYYVLIEATDGDKSEIYEATVNPLLSDVFKLKSKGNGSILTAFLEVNR